MKTEKRPITIAVASGKGGVGKSTIAALLAIAYGNQGKRVALLDVDLYGPSLPTLFDKENTTHAISRDNKIAPIVIGNLQLVSFGFILGQLPAIMRGPMIARYTEQLLHDVAWDNPDIMIIDLPPGTGDIHLTVSQNSSVDAALIVTVPHALSFSDVGKAILMLNKVNIPVLGVLVNMAFFQCANCNSRHYLFGKNYHAAIEQRFGLPILDEIPLNQERYGQRFDQHTYNEHTLTIAHNILHALDAFDLSFKPQVENSYTDIIITLEHNRTYRISPYTLRMSCKCAVCYDEYNGRSKSMSKISRDVYAEEIKLVGNYAFYIKWSDGHATGFFPIEYVKSIATRI